MTVSVGEAEAHETARAAALIEILASALERILETASDDNTRAIAAEALSEFHGR